MLLIAITGVHTQNSCNMYNRLYEGLVKAKIAVRLPEPKWVYAKRNTVQTKDRAVNHMVEHDLDHA